jgi:hypothetical protein
MTPVTVSQLENFIKRELSSEDVAVTGVGFNSIDIVLINPKSELGFVFTSLVQTYGANIYEGDKKGEYVVTLQDGIKDDKHTPPISTSTLISFTALGAVAAWLAMHGFTLLMSYSHLILEELQKDKVP